MELAILINPVHNIPEPFSSSGFEKCHGYKALTETGTPTNIKNECINIWENMPYRSCLNQPDSLPVIVRQVVMSRGTPKRKIPSGNHERTSPSVYLKVITANVEHIGTPLFLRNRVQTKPYPPHHDWYPSQHISTMTIHDPKTETVFSLPIVYLLQYCFMFV